MNKAQSDDAAGGGRGTAAVVVAAGAAVVAFAAAVRGPAVALAVLVAALDADVDVAGCGVTLIVAPTAADRLRYTGNLAPGSTATSAVAVMLP
jgi:hypothetical protein